MAVNKTLPELLNRFSREGRDKAEYLISRWAFIEPGTKEILIKSRDYSKTLIRICKYKNEYLHIKYWLLDKTKIDWLVNKFGAKVTQAGNAYNVFLERISYKDIDEIIDRVLLAKKVGDSVFDEPQVLSEEKLIEDNIKVDLDKTDNELMQTIDCSITAPSIKEFDIESEMIEEQTLIEARWRSNTIWKNKLKKVKEY